MGSQRAPGRPGQPAGAAAGAWLWLPALFIYLLQKFTFLFFFFFTSQVHSTRMLTLQKHLPGSPGLAQPEGWQPTFPAELSRRNRRNAGNNKADALKRLVWMRDHWKSLYNYYSYL